MSTESGDAKRPPVLMKSIEAELVETIHSSGTTECKNIHSKLAMLLKKTNERIE